MTMRIQTPRSVPQIAANRIDVTQDSFNVKCLERCLVNTWPLDSKVIMELEK